MTVTVARAGMCCGKRTRVLRLADYDSRTTKTQKQGRRTRRPIPMSAFAEVEQLAGHQYPLRHGGSGWC